MARIGWCTSGWGPKGASPRSRFRRADWWRRGGRHAEPVVAARPQGYIVARRNLRRSRRVRGVVPTTGPRIAMRLLLCSVGLAICPVLAVCQRPVPAKLSLADAVALARSNNPLYGQAINDRAPAAWARSLIAC